MAASEKILILGTKTFAEEIADIVDQIPSVELAGFVENMDKQRCREKLLGKPIYWYDQMARLADDHLAICALSTTRRSHFTDQAEDIGMRFATIIHPTASISGKSNVADGSIISTRVTIASYTELGRHVIVNRTAVIGHHAEISDYVTIQPGANIAGACSIGKATYVGMGAIIIDHINVGSDSVIAAGAVVTKDVPDNVMVAGVPARIVRENIEGK